MDRRYVVLSIVCDYSSLQPAASKRAEISNTVSDAYDVHTKGRNACSTDAHAARKKSIARVMEKIKCSLYVKQLSCKCCIFDTKYRIYTINISDNNFTWHILLP